MNQQFDRNIARKIREHESKVPHDMWDRIQGAQRKKKRYPFWPIFVFGGGLLIGGLWYLFVQNNDTGVAAMNTSKVETAITNSQAHQSSNTAETSERMLNSSTNDELNNTNTDNKIEASINTNKSEKENIELNSTEVRNQKNNSTKIVDPANENNSTSAPLRVDNVSNAQRSNVVSEAGNSHIITRPEVQGETTPGTGQINNNISKVEQEFSQSNSTEIIDGRNNVENESNVVSTELNSESANNTLEGDLIDKAVQERQMNHEPIQFLEPFANERSGGVDKLAPSKGKAFGYGTMIYDPCSVRGTLKRRRLDCYQFVQQTQYTFADFVIGPQYFVKQMSAKNDERALLDARNNSESYRLSYHAQVRLGIKMPAGLTGTIGVSYDRLNEHLYYFNPNEVRNITVTYPGDNTITYQAVGARTVDQTNSMQFISIPITGGYTWAENKFDVGLHAGAVFNVAFSKSGKIVDTEGVKPLTEDLKREIYRKNAGVGLMAGAMFTYHIDKHFSFVVEPRLQYTLRTITPDEYSLDQQHLNVGLNLGIRRRLQQKITHKKKYGVD